MNYKTLLLLMIWPSVFIASDNSAQNLPEGLKAIITAMIDNRVKALVNTVKELEKKVKLLDEDRELIEADVKTLQKKLKLLEEKIESVDDQAMKDNMGLYDDFDARLKKLEANIAEYNLSKKSTDSGVGNSGKKGPGSQTLTNPVVHQVAQAAKVPNRQ